MNFSVNADIKLNGEVQWRALFGWPNSSKSLVPAPAAPPAQLAGSTAAPAASHVSLARLRPAPAAAAPAPAPTCPGRGAPKGERLLEKLTFAGAVAEIKSLLHLANKAETNSAYWGNVALTAGWSPNSVFQKEQQDYERSRGGRKRAKLGSSGPWVATRPAIEYLLKRWKLYD